VRGGTVGTGGVRWLGHAVANGGRELSDQRLADQQRIGFMLAIGAIVLVALLTLWGWVRASRKRVGSRGRRREVLALANSLIPPEVRDEHPDARITELSSDAERSLWRRHGLMLIAAMCLPLLGLASMRSERVRDKLSWIGEHPTLTLAIAGPIAIAFVLAQLRLATRSVADRSELLGLRVVESPSIGVGYRGGAVKPTAVGSIVRAGTRFGRQVEMTSNGGGFGATTRTRVVVDAPVGTGRASDGRWTDCPRAWQAIDPGPGDVTATSGPDGIVVERTVSFSASTPDVIEAELSDLRVAEAIAARVPAAPPA
jgi:hypothetical protein